MVSPCRTVVGLIFPDCLKFEQTCFHQSKTASCRSGGKYTVSGTDHLGWEGGRGRPPPLNQHITRRIFAFTLALCLGETLVLLDKDFLVMMVYLLTVSESVC